MANLGKYEIREQLGTGSMGTVYRARDTVLDRDVALKTIRTGTDIEPEMRERFYREARSCGRLQHPHIVTIYDLGESDHTAFIAMELLEGADFRKVIEERRVGPLADKLELMIQICDALSHAHRHGVIHRDVKPSNVFLAGPNCVKVLDFGIARLPSSRLTVVGNILGTPNYMAPEQILAKPFDGRADLFAAGVVFFEFLVGQHPFRGSLIPRRIVESEPDSLFDYDSGLPLLLEKVFTRAFAKEPDQRYATGTAFAADLRAVLDAIRQNSSPTFSRVMLPSERSAPEVRVLIAENLAFEPAKAPEGEDSAEWRYSEVLGLIPLFESALERNDPTEAQRHFNNLQRVAASDGRFNEALAGCRARLEKISRMAEPALSAKPTSPRICPQCGSGNRSAARFCIQCGADFEEEQTEEEPTPVVDPGAAAGGIRPKWDSGLSKNDSDTIFDQTVVMTPENLIGRDDPTQILTGAIEHSTAATAPMQQVKDWVWAHPRHLMAAAAALVVLGITLTGLPRSQKSYPLKRPVASARVAATNVGVSQSAATGSQSLYRLSKGARVNILELPAWRSQKWVPVQAIIDGRAQQPGWMLQDKLTDWKGQDADAAFKICCSFEGDPGTDQDFAVRRAALDDFVSHNPGTPEAARAITEKARLRLGLVKRHQSQGLAGDPLRMELDGAIDEAQKAGEGGVSIANELLAIRAALAQIEEPLQDSGPAVDVNSPAVLLWRAERMFRNGDYRAAKRLIGRIAADKRDDPKIKELMDKIDNALKIETQ